MTMDRKIYTIESNAPVAPQVYRMVLHAEDAPEERCGRFVEVEIPGKFLRRPISVSMSEPGRLTLLYKVVGGGTAALAAMEPGSGRALLIGGGRGAAPLHQLCRDLRSEGKRVTAILGFNTASEILLREEMEALGATVHVATADGSCGIRGLVTDALRETRPDYDYYYVCGPMPMMKALYPVLPDCGEFSLEERMGCGTGLCFGCTVQTTAGPRRICHDGPVFKKNMLPW